MRALVDLGQNQVNELDRLARERKTSRAALIREAIDAYVEIMARPAADAFGLWQGRGVDGLEFQQRARSEW